MTEELVRDRPSGDALADAQAEAKRLSAHIEELDLRLEFVLAASRTGIWEWRVAEDSLTWSEQISIQHGLAPGEAPADFEAYLAMVHPDDRQHFLDRLGATMESGEPYNVEFRVVWPDGSVHWTHGAGRVFMDPDGRPARMIGTGQDITERRLLELERDRLLEQEHRTNEWREAFIDILSHELRTPITTILGASTVLLRPRSDEGTGVREGLLTDIAGEAARLNRIVGDLVVLSRSERGVLDAECEPLELRRLIARVVGDEGQHWPYTRFDLDLPDSLPIVLAEETYVEQVLRNVLGNAAKYGPRGGTVRVCAAAVDDAVTVTVLDDGPGLDEDDVERLFEPFYRSPSLARQVSGSGIGLFVCARLMEAMGGRIRARPRPEGGAEFEFALRLADVAEEPGGP